MATVKYTGFSHFRELLQEDFEKLGVKGQESLTWARNEVKEVSTEVADALHKLLGDEFTKVESDAKSALKSDSSTSTSTNSKPLSPNDV